MANPAEARVLAEALYQIRQLLSGYLGSTRPGDPAVRMAAHLAYALHNEALATVEDGGFDVDQAVAKVAAVDAIFDSNFAESIQRVAAPR
jgi:hypothetical protein